MTEFRYLNYCGECAGKLQKITDTEYRCLACSRPTFNGPVGASGVLVFRNDTVLLSVRAIEPGKGKMDEVGGFSNWMEHPERAVRREFKEETGCELQDVRIYSTLVSRYTQNMCVQGVIFIGTVAENAELVASDDVAELVWVKVSELDDSQFTTSELPGLIRGAYQDELARRKT